MKCSEIKVIKKDGTKEEFNVQKVLAAVNKSANRAMITFSKAESKFICEFVVIRTDVQHVDALLSLLPRIDGASVVMVDGIHRDARSRETWQRIVGNSHAAVCYDLYYTGIVMLDQSKHKRCYTINF